jgi:hypothetical protein
MTPRQSDLQRHGLRRVIANALAMTKGGDPHEIATNRWGRGRPPFVDVLEQRAVVSGSRLWRCQPVRIREPSLFSVSADSIVASMPLRRFLPYADVFCCVRL